MQSRIGDLLNGEARCQDVLREHSAKLVAELTREVSSALEGLMRTWIGEAVEAELRRQREA